jgi:hypothetical protein
VQTVQVLNTTINIQKNEIGVLSQHLVQVEQAMKLQQDNDEQDKWAKKSWYTHNNP